MRVCVCVWARVRFVYAAAEDVRYKVDAKHIETNTLTTPRAEPLHLKLNGERLENSGIGYATIHSHPLCPTLEYTLQSIPLPSDSN